MGEESQGGEIDQRGEGVQVGIKRVKSVQVGKEVR